MNRSASPIRSVVMPLAVMGMAMALPAGFDVVQPRVAEQVIQSTVDRAEMLVDSFAESARDLCGVTAAIVTDGPTLPVDPTDGFFLPQVDAPVTTSLAAPQRHLIDLPPPADC